MNGKGILVFAAILVFLFPLFGCSEPDEPKSFPPPVGNTSWDEYKTANPGDVHTTSPDATKIAPESEFTLRYVGSINSNIYHSPDCYWARQIYPENEIWFCTANHAAEQGYRPCKVCEPPPPNSVLAEYEDAEYFRELAESLTPK